MSANAPSQMFPPAQGMLTEAELMSAPMDDDHKELAMAHFRRLTRIAFEPDVDAIPSYTSKYGAREQLARMTLIVREYIREQQAGAFKEQEDEVESMIADLIDASFHLAGMEGTYSQPAFTSPLLQGKEQELAAMVQESLAGNVDDVSELWNQEKPKGKVLPDGPDPRYNVKNDLGKDFDWPGLLSRRRSEDDMLYHCAKPTVLSRVKMKAKLLKAKRSHLELSWPLKDVRRTRAMTMESMGDEEWWRRGTTGLPRRHMFFTLGARM